MAQAASLLHAIAAQQQDRWPLLFPLAMFAGASWWMTALTDPPVWAPPGVLGVCIVALAAALRSPMGVGPIRLAAAIAAGLAGCKALGACAAQLRTEWAAAARLTAPLPAAVVSGHVLELTQGANRPRMILLVSAIDDLPAPPLRVALSTLPGAGFPPGREVQCRARLDAPEGPMAPHAYDAARAAYFDQIGATGFTLGWCRPMDAAPPESVWDRLQVQVAAWRRALAEAIFVMAPDDGGAIAAALITGDRSLMSPAAVIALRDSGLGHLLSVSGLHMSLVGGGYSPVCGCCWRWFPNSRCICRSRRSPLRGL